MRFPLNITELNMNKGLYILASNGVFDSLVALLNSIESNYTPDIAICIIPYNDEMDLIEKEIKNRKNVFLFDDQKSINRWENFFQKLHQLYLDYPYKNITFKKTQVLNMYRKCCAFDGPFDQFIYIDCDTLVFQPLDYLFAKLDNYDCVSHDFQRLTSIRKNEVSRFYELFKDNYQSEAELATQFHCGGFWGYEKGKITSDDLDYFYQSIAGGDLKIFAQTFFDDTPVMNYMNLKKGLNLYNVTLDKTSEYNTGSCVTSRHFEEKDQVLYDHGKKLTYLHYMGIKSASLNRLSWWKQMHFPCQETLFRAADKVFDWQLTRIPYKKTFLHYRFLSNSTVA